MVMGITVYRCLKIKVDHYASIFIYKLAVGLYFMILHLFSYFHKCGGGGGGEGYPTAQNVTSGRARILAFGFLVCSLEFFFPV